MFDVQSIITGGGLLLIGLIIFAESGVMVGLFFPGDTLLLSAGVLAAAGSISLPAVLAVVTVAAILGDNVGYLIGKHLGPRLFKKDGIIFRHEYIVRAEAFYKKYGTKTMLVAHFVPIVRSFAPVAAGAGKMNHKLFILFDAIGDTLWAFSTTLIGYYVASKIPGIEKFIEPMLIGIVIIFLAPTLFHALRDERVRSKLVKAFRKRPQAKDSADQ